MTKCGAELAWEYFIIPPSKLRRPQPTRSPSWRARCGGAKTYVPIFTTRETAFTQLRDKRVSLRIGTNKETLNIWMLNYMEDVSMVGNALYNSATSQFRMRRQSTPSTPAKTSVSLRAGAASTLKLGQIARALSDTTGSGGYDKVARFSFRGTDIKAFLLPAGC